MDFKQLETFIAVAKCESFSKASKFLYLTQPTLTNHIQNLEKELGLNLFHRKNRKVTLTEAGKIFLPQAENILSKKEQVLYDLDKFSGEIRGTIDLPASTIPEEFLIPNLIFGFQKQHPKVKFNIHHLDSFEVSQAICDGVFEFGLLGAKFKDDLHYIPLLQDEMIAIGSPDNPLPCTAITFKDLVHSPLILREEGSGSGKFFLRKAKESGFNIKDLNIAITCENTQAIKKMVVKNLGFAIISKLAATEDIQKGKLIGYQIQGENMYRTFYFAFKKNSEISSIGHEFKNYILNLPELPRS